MYYVRKANKYGAKRTEFGGRVYDSKHEAGIAQEIELLRKSGEVVKVEPQKTYPLLGLNKNRICTHRPDFTLTFKDGHIEIWEAKGFSTPMFTLKLKLFTDNYPELLYYVITPRETFRYGSKSNRYNTRGSRARAA